MALTNRNILSCEEIDNALNEKLTDSNNSSFSLDYSSVINSWPVQDAIAINKTDSVGSDGSHYSKCELFSLFFPICGRTFHII
jgi:hypothetical protein